MTLDNVVKQLKKNQPYQSEPNAVNDFPLSKSGFKVTTTNSINLIDTSLTVFTSNWTAAGEAAVMY